MSLKVQWKKKTLNWISFKASNCQEEGKTGVFCPEGCDRALNRSFSGPPKLFWPDFPAARAHLFKQKLQILEHVFWKNELFGAKKRSLKPSTIFLSAQNKSKNGPTCLSGKLHRLWFMVKAFTEGDCQLRDLIQTQLLVEFIVKRWQLQKLKVLWNLLSLVLAKPLWLPGLKITVQTRPKRKLFWEWQCRNFNQGQTKQTEFSASSFKP